MRLLRDAMRRNSGRIWHEKARADNLSLFLNEETITEMLLLRLLSTAQTNDFRLQVFNKAEEVKTGADWEFWFIGLQNVVVLRIQAKRLFRSGLYASLDPQGQQTSQLIRDARTWKCHPFFAFYNDATYFPKPYPVCLCDEYRAPSYCGCVLVPAPLVQKLGTKNPTVLANVAFPWHCLLCDNGRTRHADLASIVAGKLGIDLREEVAAPAHMLDLVEATDKELHGLDRGQSYLERRKLAGVALFEVLE